MKKNRQRTSVNNWESRLSVWELTDHELRIVIASARIIANLRSNAERAGESRGSQKVNTPLPLSAVSDIMA